MNILLCNIGSVAVWTAIRSKYDNPIEQWHRFEKHMITHKKLEKEIIAQPEFARQMLQFPGVKRFNHEIEKLTATMEKVVKSKK